MSKSDFNCRTILPNGEIIYGIKNKIMFDDVCLEHDKHEITCLIVLSNDLIVAGTMDGKLTLWNLSTQERQFSFLAHSKKITALIVLPDGRVVSGSDDTKIKVWDFIKKRHRFTLHGHGTGITSLIYIKDTVISASQNGSVTSWNLKNKKAGKILKLDHPVTHLEVIENRIICVVELNIEVYDLNGKFICAYIGHEDMITCIKIYENKIYSGSKDKTVRIWTDEYGYEEIKYFHSEIRDILMIGSYLSVI